MTQLQQLKKQKTKKNSSKSIKSDSYGFYSAHIMWFGMKINI